MCVFVSGIAEADTFSTRYGQTTCSETVENDTGRSLEFYGEMEDDDEYSLGFSYTIEFQKPTRMGRCDDINRLAIQRMQLDLQRQQIELELLRERRDAARVEANRLDPEW